MLEKSNHNMIDIDLFQLNKQFCLCHNTKTYILVSQIYSQLWRHFFPCYHIFKNLIVAKNTNKMPFTLIFSN